jgi:anti-anti-sigma regulatory factor
MASGKSGKFSETDFKEKRCNVVIPFFRKGSDEPPASKPGDKKSSVQADPHTSTLDFSGGDPRALAIAAGKIHVDELSDADHPAVEEAAILFANGSDEAAAVVLQSAIESNGASNETLWIMLFDLCRLTGRKELFDQHGVAYATQFSRSPPVWSELGAAAAPAKKPARDATPSVGLTGTLNEQAGSQFDQISKIALKAGKLKIDLGRLRGADAAGCEKLMTLLQSLRQARVKVRFANARNMLPMIEGHVQAGHREGQAIWLVMLELLQALEEQERFEEVALDYAITFEESPPSYEAPTAAKSGADTSSPTVSQISSGLELVPIESELESYAFEGTLSSAQNETIRSLAKFGANRSTVEIDASRLERMDFVSAGNLFNVLVQFQAGGKLSIIRGLNGMVAALLRVMGVHQVAQMELRKS